MRPAPHDQKESPGERAVTLLGTFVLLLVVIAILVLLYAAMISSLGPAPESRITLEMAQMAQHFELMKQEYGEYPPSDPAAAESYAQKVSPQFDSAVNTTELDGFPAGNSKIRAEKTKDERERALVFWLNGVSRNPTNPITGGGTRDFAFEFDNDQFTSDKRRYLPPLDDASQPFRYESSGSTYTISSAGVDDTWDTDDDLTVPDW